MVTSESGMAEDRQSTIGFPPTPLKVRSTARYILVYTLSIIAAKPYLSYIHTRTRTKFH